MSKFKQFPMKMINCEIQTPEKRRLPYLPNILRCGIIGPSGSGKTFILVNILAHIKLPEHIYLCTKTANQDKYKLLQNCRNLKIHVIEDVAELPDPNDVPEESIVIFDDVLTLDQKKIAEFYLRGRHRTLSSFYLTQSFTKIPKKFAIRNNFNYLIILKQDNVNLRQIYIEYVNDLTFDEFRQVCMKCWKKPHGFLAIDVEKSDYYI